MADGYSKTKTVNTHIPLRSRSKIRAISILRVRPFLKALQASRTIIHIPTVTEQKERDFQLGMSNTRTIITGQSMRRTPTQEACIALHPAYRSTNVMSGAVAS